MRFPSIFTAVLFAASSALAAPVNTTTEDETAQIPAEAVIGYSDLEGDFDVAVLPFSNSTNNGLLFINTTIASIAAKEEGVSLEKREAEAYVTVAKAQWGRGASAGQKLSVGGGQNQHKGVSDGFSYEIWLDNTGGSGSMTLCSGATFKAEWNAAVNRGNFLARRGLDFGSRKKATDYSYIRLDYTATYRQTASASGNSRLCVYGWFQNRGVQGVPLVEYYIIEDWVDWVPDAQGKMVTIDGAQYKIFQMDHTGPTINGGSETFKQYFSVRQQKRTSGHITVSDHFKEWAKQGWGIGNLYEVALNAEGWQSSGIADVTKLDVYTTQKGSNPTTAARTTRTTARTTARTTTRTRTLPTNNKCSSKITAQGYECCSSPNCEIVYTDDDGKWGKEFTSLQY